MSAPEKIHLEKIDDCRYRIPRSGKMRVDGIIYADAKLIRNIHEDESPRQVANVAHLPGILEHSLAMPDIHWGYGFPIGGVAAFDWKEGVISPGGVGYDINCGTRVVRTNLTTQDLRPKIRELVQALFQNIPSGVGSKGALRLSAPELRRVLKEGSSWAVENGYGSPEDLEHTEDGGCLAGADPSLVSERALDRGRPQLGTLGSGNHFLEVGYVEEIYDPEVARVFGLAKDQVTVFIHSGSRGLGYQVCDDFLKKMGERVRHLGLELPDRQLACDYVQSQTGQDYLSAMAAAANYAWANRQMLMHWTREVFENVLQMSPRDLGMRLLYDVCHNIAKRETHTIGGERREVCVHRKGATRAFGPGHHCPPGNLPEDRSTGFNPRGHGAVFLCPRGNAGGHGADLRQHLPRGRPAAEPDPGETVEQGQTPSPGAGGSGNLRHGLKPGNSGGRGSGGVQGCERGGGGGSPGRDFPQGGEATAVGSD